jgi:hypothetical protein
MGHQMNFAGGLRWPWGVALGCAVAVAVAVAADILVCRECGYENARGAAACRHCRAALPVTAEPRVPSASDKIEYLGAAVVQDEVEQGQKAMRERDFELARLFLRNAAALETLTDPREGGERAQHILRMLRECESMGGRVGRKCGPCGGSGKRSVSTQTLSGATLTHESSVACTQCRGTGQVLAFGSIDERKFAMGRAQEQFTRVQQSRKFIPIGNAWVPPDFQGRLTARQGASLKRATATPCEECNGLGRVQCPGCDGNGYTRCTNRRCAQGYVEERRDTRLSHSKRTVKQRCSTCGGRSIVACPGCKSEGSILCENCKGTGQRGVCAKCSGQGFADCRRCGGSGLIKTARCSDCGGEGVSFCRTCDGDGRKK